MATNRTTPGTFLHLPSEEPANQEELDDMRKNAYLVVWWMSQVPYAAVFDNRVAAEAADRARMNDEVERDVRFDGATARLRGRLRPPIGRAWGSLVMSHGRSEDMGSLLLSALAQTASDQGLWALRFNFAFADSGSEPSGGHADEIADLREAMGYARTTAGLDTVFVAGRG